MRAALLVLLLALAARASATSYFVSQAGNDGNTGLTDAQAWKTCAGKVNGFAFVPDDVVQFRRGDTWNEQCRITASGTSGHPIIVTNYSLTLGGSLPIISTNLVADGAFRNAARSWITVENLELRGGTNGYGFYTFGAGPTVQGLVIQDCTLSGNHGLLAAATAGGVHTNIRIVRNDISPTTSGLTHSGIEFTGLDNIVQRIYTNIYIANNTIHPAGEDAIIVEDSQDVMVLGNTILGPDGENCVDFKDSSRILVDGNFCDTTTEYGMVAHDDEAEANTPSGLTFDVTFSHNYIAHAGQGGVNTQAFFLHYVDDSHITGNTITASKGGAVLVNDAEASANANEISYNLIYGTNTTGADPAVFQIQDGAFTKLWNNTVYGAGNNAAVVQIIGGAPNHTTDVQLRNNVFYQTGTGRHVSVAALGTTNFTSDYNDFYPNDAGRFSWSGGASTNFATWKTNSGGDAHSVVGDPLFIAPLTLDFTMKTTETRSPAIDAGTPLGLLVDIVGRAVPMGARVDMGAYESFPVLEDPYPCMD